MDNETKEMFGLILQKLGGIETRLDKIENRLDKVETKLDKVEDRLDKVETKLDKVEDRLDKVEDRLEGIEKRQDEMYLIQRSLEENVKVTRAEQEKMMYAVADIQGKVSKMDKEVDEHETVIKQIRAIN